MAFPKVDKKLTKGLAPVNFVLAEEGDELDGIYAGSANADINGREILAHYFVTDDGVATILSRRNLDAWLKEESIETGERVHIVRGEDKNFKKDGEKRSMHNFECERVNGSPKRKGKR